MSKSIDGKKDFFYVYRKCPECKAKEYHYITLELEDRRMLRCGYCKHAWRTVFQTYEGL